MIVCYLSIPFSPYSILFAFDVFIILFCIQL